MTCSCWLLHSSVEIPEVAPPSAVPKDWHYILTSEFSQHDKGDDRLTLCELPLGEVWEAGGVYIDYREEAHRLKDRNGREICPLCIHLYDQRYEPKGVL